VAVMAEQGTPQARAGQDKRPGFWRFGVQYLVSPILVAAIGFYFNMSLQETRDELERSRQQLDRIEVAHDLIRDALSSDYEQCFITLRLVEVVLDPELAGQVVDGVTEYLARKAGMELAEGRPEEAVAIVKAAQSSGGNAGRKVEDGIKEALPSAQTPERLSRAKQAESYTSEGFRHLLSGRYQEAIDAFGKAEETYPGYGAASEIAEELKQNLPQMNDPAAERKVISEIAERFSWQSQKEYVQEIRERFSK
jgi:tetratricopeptide (TPR) repeat protein